MPKKLKNANATLRGKLWGVKMWTYYFFSITHYSPLNKLWQKLWFFFFNGTSIFPEKLYIPKFCFKYNTMLRFNAKHLKDLMQNIETYNKSSSGFVSHLE